MHDINGLGTDDEMDQALIVQIRDGNRKAMGKLVERHKKLAYQFALGMVGNRDDAYDISQEAFLRVYRSAARFDVSRPFLPWFYTIISNLCKSWLRKRSRRDHRMVDVDHVDYLLVSDDNPEKELIRKESLASLGRALIALPIGDREIISLQHFRGMSYDEIAALLKVPRGTVMSRLYYARKKLARLMRNENGKV